MTVKCSVCGTPLANGWVGPCPKCSTIDSNALRKNYSATVSTSSSTFSAYDAIISARNALTSAAIFNTEDSSFIQPIIDQLDAAATVTKEQEMKLINARKESLDEYAKKISEFAELLKRHCKEPDFQKFFEENPTFLDPLVAQAIPKKSFGGEKFPDFVLRLHNGNYKIAELEDPSLKLYNSKGNPTAELTRGQEQIREYLSMAVEDKEWLRKRGLEKITAENTSGLLVIGSELAADEERKLNILNKEVSGSYRIMTFVHILNENMHLLENLKSRKS